MLFAPVNIVDISSDLSQSALPNAPVVLEPEPRPGVVRPFVRAQASRLLRAVARHELRLADRLDPQCEPSM